MWEMVLLMSNPNQGSGQGGGSGLLGFLPFILIIVIFYFLLIRPQAKRQKTVQKMLESVKKGDLIVTAGGIHGKVVGTKDNILIVEIDDNVKVELDRGSVGRIVSPGEGTTGDEKIGKTK
jgi:preprotein translocase subunit YajC